MNAPTSSGVPTRPMGWFLAIPSLNKALVLELARCEYIDRKDNVIALGNSGTGKTHIALGSAWLRVREDYQWVLPRPPPWSTS